MTWWCSTVNWPWTWTWTPYLGAWLVVAALVVPYALSMRRRARDTGLTATDRRAIAWYALGVLFVWSASDWPLAALGASYLLTAHTAQFILYAMTAAPLLLVGVPEWMARRLLQRLRAYRAYRAVTNLWFAAIFYNAVLVVTHVPAVLDGLRATQPGSFLLDLSWLLAGLLAWSPVVSTLPEVRLRGAIARCTFLFLSTAIVPMIPAALITFAAEPLYATYEIAPRIGTIGVIDDQQLAGAVMKVTGVFITFPVIATIFLKASLVESRHVGVDPDRPDQRTAAG